MLYSLNGYFKCPSNKCVCSCRASCERERARQGIDKNICSLIISHASLNRKAMADREREPKDPIQQMWLTHTSKPHFVVLKVIKYFNYLECTKRETLKVILKIGRRWYIQQVSTRLKGLILNTTKSFSFSTDYQNIQISHYLHLNISSNIIQ